MKNTTPPLVSERSSPYFKSKMKGPFFFKRPRFALLPWLVWHCLLLAGIAQPADPWTPSRRLAKMLDIADTIAANRITTKFATMLQASEMATFLSSKGPFDRFCADRLGFLQASAGHAGSAAPAAKNKERLNRPSCFSMS